ncbi:hypothetical protein [Gimesia panareensis]|uniref:hypothetical protein n=1 Tax=Gimesia panareensis TaxID=2527978 RepID=UPI0011887BB2|nr:hypothetical protein [Gimesia panareensis]QDU52119.1 hypothetical protein Pan110_44910 [Gimesia panareensis]
MKKSQFHKSDFLKPSFVSHRSNAGTANRMSPIDLVAYALNCNLLDESLHEKIQKQLERNPERLLKKTALMRKIEKAVMQDVQHRKIKAPFPQRRECEEGDIILGRDPFNENKYQTMYSESLPKNILLQGPPGCGKTTFIMSLIFSLMLIVKTLLFDESKNELRRLIPVYAELGHILHMIKLQDFPFGLLEVPEGVNPRDCVEPFALSIADSIASSEPGVRLLREIIFQLYETRGIFAGSRNFPNGMHLREAIAEHPKAQKLIKDGLLNRLDPILLSLNGLRYQKGEDIERILDSHILLECDSVSSEASNLIKGLIVTKAVLLKKAKGIVNAAPSWFCVMDDAQEICRNPGGPIPRSIHYSRSFGLGCLFSAQTSDITDSVMANCGTKILGKTNSGRDLEFFTKSMGLLGLNEKRWLAENLVSGLFLAQLADGCNTPFLFRAIDPQLPPLNYDPVQAQPSSNFSVLGTSLLECVEHRNWVPPDFKRNQKSTGASSKTLSSTLNEKEFEYLSAVFKHPEGNFTFYLNYFKNQNIKINQSQGKKIREKLQMQGLIEIIEIQGSDGRASMQHFPTHVGQHVLRELAQKTQSEE